MSTVTSWNIERVWGEDNFYNDGDIAEDKYAFVIDSGVTKLDDLNINEQWSKSFLSNSLDQDPFEDFISHGTAVASIIGAKNNNEGLVGVAPGTQIVSLKVFGQYSTTNTSTVEAALLHAKEVILENNLQDKAVINMSLSSSKASFEIVEEMASLGIRFSVSAGNSYGDVNQRWPAQYGYLENVYTASSIDNDDYMSNFSSFDDDDGRDDVDYASPGGSAYSYKNDGSISTFSGTSFSAPHLAGLVLLGGMKSDGFTLFQKSARNSHQKNAVADPIAVLDYDKLAPKVFTGTDGRDQYNGWRFDDIINTGTGRDKVSGGDGADTFVLNKGYKFCKIIDYDSSMDVLVLPEGDLTIKVKSNKDITKLYVDDDLIAKINGTDALIV